MKTAVSPSQTSGLFFSIVCNPSSSSCWIHFPLPISVAPPKNGPRAVQERKIWKEEEEGNKTSRTGVDIGISCCNFRIISSRHRRHGHSVGVSLRRVRLGLLSGPNIKTTRAVCYSHTLTRALRNRRVRKFLAAYDQAILEGDISMERLEAIKEHVRNGAFDSDDDRSDDEVTSRVASIKIQTFTGHTFAGV